MKFALKKLISGFINCNLMKFQTIWTVYICNQSFTIFISYFIYIPTDLVVQKSKDFNEKILIRVQNLWPNRVSYRKIKQNYFIVSCRFL